MLLLQVFGKTKMLRKVFFANYLEESVKNSHRVEEEDSEEKSISYYVVILLLLSHSCYNMFIRLPQEVFILQEREVQLLV